MNNVSATQTFLRGSSVLLPAPNERPTITAHRLQSQQMTANGTVKTTDRGQFWVIVEQTLLVTRVPMMENFMTFWKDVLKAGFNSFTWTDWRSTVHSTCYMLRADIQLSSRGNLYEVNLTIRSPDMVY